MSSWGAVVALVVASATLERVTWNGAHCIASCCAARARSAVASTSAQPKPQPSCSSPLAGSPSQSPTSDSTSMEEFEDEAAAA